MICASAPQTDPPRSIVVPSLTTMWHHLHQRARSLFRSSFQRLRTGRRILCLLCCVKSLTHTGSGLLMQREHLCRTADVLPAVQEQLQAAGAARCSHSAPNKLFLRSRPMTSHSSHILDDCQYFSTLICPQTPKGDILT